MNKKINILFLVLFCAFATVLYVVVFASDWSTASSSALPEGIRPGGPAVAPDFDLTDLEGHRVRLSDLRGKVVLVNFWATWCGPCRVEIPSLVSLRHLMAGKEFVLVTISIDEGGRDAVETFFRGLGVHLPTVLDADNKVAGAYGITGVPETFLIDKAGRIEEHFIGPRDWTDGSFLSRVERLLQTPAAPGSV
jgi:thiol-disulfide isomerase/thioredoxin